MPPSQNLYDLQIHFECSGNLEKYLTAYQDGAGIWTIGMGTTYYPNGEKVKQGDTCTIDEAISYHRDALEHIIAKVEAAIPDTVTQGMFDACVDFAYNAGLGAFLGSTLHSLIQKDPTDFAAIGPHFLQWNKLHKNGQLVESPGLLRRRKCECYLYQHNQNAPGFLQ
jgi:lysozyme